MSTKLNKFISDQLLEYCEVTGNNFLHIIIIMGDFECFKIIICILKLLKDYHYEIFEKVINKKNRQGDTPAHIAVRKSNQSNNNIYSIMVETLFDLGANFSIPNNNKEIIINIDENAEYDEQHTKMFNDIKNCSNIYDNDSNSDDDPKYLSDMDTDSSVFIFNQIEDKQKLTPTRTGTIKVHILKGGGKKEYESSSESSTDDKYKGKRNLYNSNISMDGGSKKSQEIHNDMIEKLKGMGYGQQDAEDIKNFIYYEVKAQYPKLNNTDRSEKMLEVINDTLAEMDMKEIREELEKYREKRKQNTETKKSTKKSTKKEPKKETKKETKKSSKKEPKRSSKKSKKSKK
jgi:hypothetical protein